MIGSIKDKRTEAVLNGRAPKGFPTGILRAAQLKFAMLVAAERLSDLRVPPGNRLEALKGDRARQHSIRINEQWRICFRWDADRAEDVEIVDYH